MVVVRSFCAENFLDESLLVSFLCMRFALLYFPQKSEDNTYVRSQCRHIVHWTIDSTYTFVCKYLFVSIYIISLFVYFFRFLDNAPGGGQINYQLQSLVSLLPFVPTLKGSQHGYPLTDSCVIV